ncbi:uncharacterized protein G2W53_035215 [Senna tora]|uniref:Uncharacterized protein n=1 Tax=Senna tora TaxID=362788 RepID=A0A834SVE9_9FABA|nr:uncharacterized protein G2W53_035215 [Senna tora]
MPIVSLSNLSAADRGIVLWLGQHPQDMRDLNALGYGVLYGIATNAHSSQGKLNVAYHTMEELCVEFSDREVRLASMCEANDKLCQTMCTILWERADQEHRLGIVDQNEDSPLTMSPRSRTKFYSWEY